VKRETIVRGREKGEERDGEERENLEA